MTAQSPEGIQGIQGIQGTWSGSSTEACSTEPSAPSPGCNPIGPIEMAFLIGNHPNTLHPVSWIKVIYRSAPIELWSGNSEPKGIGKPFIVGILYRYKTLQSQQASIWGLKFRTQTLVIYLGSWFLDFLLLTPDIGTIMKLYNQTIMSSNFVVNQLTTKPDGSVYTWVADYMNMTKSCVEYIIWCNAQIRLPPVVARISVCITNGVSV